MGIACGIVGLPNVGKSTLFNALTKAQIAAENYPFCTIEPNVGIVAVPDERLDVLAGIVNPAKIVPASTQFVDIAGLVEGASKGEGLGNQFLAHIRETDATIHVVRCFEDEDVTHVAGSIDPLRDVDIIQTELALADLESVAKAIDKATRAARSGDAEAKARLAALEIISPVLNEGRPARAATLSAEARLAIRDLQLITMKPALYVANVREDSSLDVERVAALRARAESEGAEVLEICAAIEGEIAQLDDDDRAEFLADLGLEEPGLDRLIRAGYRLLGLQTYFTAGPTEVRAWTVRTGATAPQAAGVIHSDFEKGFIRAEVIGYDDFVAGKGEQGAKDAGKWRLEGKEYLVREGDVVHFRFNV